MKTEEMLRAVDRVYRTHCARHGGGYQPPNWADSAIKGRYAVLRNCNGVLARYKISKYDGHYHFQLVN